MLHTRFNLFDEFAFLRMRTLLLYFVGQFVSVYMISVWRFCCQFVSSTVRGSFYSLRDIGLSEGRPYKAFGLGRSRRVATLPFLRHSTRMKTQSEHCIRESAAY